MKKEKTTQKEVKNKNKGGYGVLSLMAMIIGIVIGSGIFAKNAGLIATAGSTAIVALTWLVGALVVITLVIAFIEIITITELADKQSTTANWGRMLLGVRFGKFIGYYITLVYFPIIIAALFQFASGSFLETVSYATPTQQWFLDLQADPFNYMLAIIGTSFSFLIVIMLINAISQKPGKYFQNIGTMVKTIPLFFVIIVFLYMITSNPGNIQFASADDLVAAGATAKTGSVFALVMATIPAVLFAFDGFLLAGSLSKESKSPASFRIAFIASMIFIILIYLTFSVAVLGLGTFDDAEFIAAHGKYGSITNSIYSVFAEPTANVISPIVNGIITISMLTGVSGCSIASYRSLSDLSANNFVKDPDMKYLRKNRRGVSEGAGIAIIAIVIFWYALSISMDTYLAYNTGINLAIADFSSNLIVVLAYFLYVLIIFGGLVNRFKKKENRVPTKKNFLFIPAAIISIIMTTIITGYFAYDILSPMFDTTLSGDEKLVAQMQLLYTIIFFVMIVLIYFVNSINTWRLDEKFKNKKEIASAVYYDPSLEEVMIPEELVREKLTTLNSKVAEYIEKSEAKHKEEIEALKAEKNPKSKKK